MMKANVVHKSTSIRLKLAIGIAAISFAALAVVSAWGWWLMKSEAENLTMQVLTEQALRNTQQAEASIQSVQLMMQGLADASEVADAPMLADALPAIRRFMAKNQAVTDSVLISGPDGKRMAADGGVADMNDRIFFKRIIAERVPLVSEMLIARSTGKPSISVVVPWKGLDGQFRGGIWCTVALDSLQAQTEAIRFGDTGYGFVTNDEGFIIADGANKEAVGKVNFNKLPDGDPMKALWKKAFDSKKAVSGNYQFDGKSYFGVFTPMQVPGGRVWVVTVALEQRELDGNAAKAGMGLLGGSIVLALLAAGAAYIWARSFSTPIIKCVAAAQRIASGDVRPIAKTINSNDELGDLSDAIVAMNDSIRALALDFQDKSSRIASSSEQLTASADQSARAAGQVAGSITQMASGTEKQATDVSGATSTVDKMVQEIKAATEGAGRVAEVSGQTGAAAEQGQQAIQSAVAQMNAIAAGSAKVQETVNKLAASSAQIGDIVNVISGIAGQTNLLALNAAIEAARAGEAGRGFAVVAEEVRKLAEQSHQAAQEITGLIAENHVNMEHAVQAMAAGTGDVKTGTAVVQQAGHAFDVIVQAARKAQTESGQITGVMKQVDAGADLVVAAMKEIDYLSRENSSEAQNVSAAAEEMSASMEEIASSSEELSHMAQEMQVAVTRFRV